MQPLHIDTVLIKIQSKSLKKFFKIYEKYKKILQLKLIKSLIFCYIRCNSSKTLLDKTFDLTINSCSNSGFKENNFKEM